MYEEGILPSNGCDRCCLPYEFCNDWVRDDDGEWVRQDIEPHPQCQYSPYLLGDTIIGLYHCGKSEFEQELFDDVEEYCERVYFRMEDNERGEHEWVDYQVTFDGETVACCLSQPLIVAGVEGSEMIRKLAVFTRMIWDAIGKDH